MEADYKMRIAYKRLLYVTLMILLFVIKFTSGNMELLKGLIAVVIFILFSFAGVYVRRIDYNINYKNRLCLYLFAEVAVCNIFELLYINDIYVVVGLLLLQCIDIFEYLTYYAFYDGNLLMVKKVIVTMPAAINLIVAFSRTTSYKSEFCYSIIHVIALTVVYFAVGISVFNDREKQAEINSLIAEKSDMKRNNDQLVEYQDKVRAVNEQINYQKIELSRAIDDLERVNSEVKAQTEVMKYMASTFNITKCMSSVANAVVDVRKAKVCALYVDGNMFMSKYPVTIVNTNYSSLQSRLNKDFQKIFEETAAGASEPAVYKGDSVKKFRFVGETNIASLAIFPIDNGESIYGIMIVASDKENYFDKGISFFESGLAEFNIAVKSIRLYLQMQDMAHKDGLTGIYNRVYFKELFKSATDVACAKNTPLSVALFDIDKFKNVNDTYGHLAGDEVIKMIASTDAKYADKYGGFACRYGGEEFLLVLPGYDSKEALAVLEEMHEEIKNTSVVYDDIEIKVNCCIGLSTYPTICDNAALLVNRADKAMYYGKRNGRGRLVLDNPSIDEIA